MAASSRSKSADRQAILKKLLPLLKKQYKVTIPKLDRPVMETMLYAVCLENSTVEQADEAFSRFMRLFPDLNEARVSSIAEIEPVFENMEGKDWRAFRTRAILQFIFDKTYNFEFESLRKKTLELATKQMAKIKHLSPFVRTFTLQQVVGAHVIPIDETTSHFLVWMGLASPGQSADEMGEGLKTLVRKAESQQFSFSVRAAAADPSIKNAFDPAIYPYPEDGPDPATSIDRLTSLFKQGLSSIKPAAAPASAKSKPAKSKATPPTGSKKDSATPVKTAKTAETPASSSKKSAAVASAKATATKAKPSKKSSKK